MSTVVEEALLTNGEDILRLIIATGLEALIGYEREQRQKPAGFRTNLLVCIGACLFTLVSQNAFAMDPARIAAGVVTGIGFLGAGSIIATGGRVYGLTTAATLWLVAGIGLAVGAGEYILAITVTIIVLIVLYLKKDTSEETS